MIVFRDLFKSFGSNQVLRGINITVNEGETLFIIGSSGTGKSVTIKHLVGLLKADSGEIWLDGEEITHYDERQFMHVRKKCSMVFQAPALFDSLSVGENVAFPLRRHTRLSEKEIRDRVIETLSLVNLSMYADAMPHEISGSMAKRVSLARSIALRPKYVLYDEPTTGADPITANTLNALIKDFARKLKVTSIVVSHDMESVRQVADRVIMLYKGKVQFDGSPQALFSSADPIVRQFVTGVAEGPME
ncbi:MAG: ABC transporter ATP-binding protein [Bdellovibrionota bacterium]